MSFHNMQELFFNLIERNYLSKVSLHLFESFTLLLHLSPAFLSLWVLSSIKAKFLLMVLCCGKLRILSMCFLFKIKDLIPVVYFVKEFHSKDFRLNCETF